MLRQLIIATAALTIATPALAAPCRDAKGHFITCPKTPPKATRCRGRNGKFAKCGTPGAKPI
ncbi:hypothetical protein [uncultured Sphingomonas sp.]|uniref:hypothetical protein n=1 Tax=uncultured Sphingomonas sp. TaxID=158754 RepID=UPI0015773007